jgi:hypothetical protein
MWHRVVWHILTDILEEPAPLNFNVEEETQSGRKAYGYREMWDGDLVTGRTNSSKSRWEQPFTGPLFPNSVSPHFSLRPVRLLKASIFPIHTAFGKRPFKGPLFFVLFTLLILVPSVVPYLSSCPFPYYFHPRLTLPWRWVQPTPSNQTYQTTCRHIPEDSKIQKWEPQITQYWNLS